MALTTVSSVQSELHTITRAPVVSPTAPMKSSPPGVVWSRMTRLASNSQGSSHASRTDSACPTLSTPSTSSRDAAKPRR
jgi:hypothetical protein